MTPTRVPRHVQLTAWRRVLDVLRLESSNFHVAELLDEITGQEYSDLHVNAYEADLEAQVCEALDRAWAPLLRLAEQRVAKWGGERE